MSNAVQETGFPGTASGTQLIKLCAQSSTEVVLCAPFMKVDALSRVVESIPSQVVLRCITRWRPDEIVIGVSDLDVWPLLKERGNSSLWLCANLHAKYYRSDDHCLVGSANITAAALGWATQPNLELLAALSLDDPAVAGFEPHVFAVSAEVDDSVYEQMIEIVEAVSVQIRQVACQPEPIGTLDADQQCGSLSQPDPYWLPSLRNPEELFLAYAGRSDRLSSASREAANNDLAALVVPAGLSREAFDAYVGALLLQQRTIREVDAFVVTPQRFGAVRDAIASMVERPGFDADRAWQTLMRWLRYFIPHRYSLTVPHHSEVFGRTSGNGRT